MINMSISDCVTYNGRVYCWDDNELELIPVKVEKLPKESAPAEDRKIAFDLLMKRKYHLPDNQG